MKVFLIILICLISFSREESDLILEDYLYENLSKMNETLSKDKFRESLVKLIDEFLIKIKLTEHIRREEELMFRKIIKQFIILYKIEEINLKDHNHYLLNRFIEFERAYRREIYLEMMEYLGYFKKNISESVMEHILEHPYDFELNILNWEIFKFRRVGAENLHDIQDFRDEYKIIEERSLEKQQKLVSNQNIVKIKKREDL